MSDEGCCDLEKGDPNKVHSAKSTSANDYAGDSVDNINYQT